MPRQRQRQFHYHSNDHGNETVVLRVKCFLESKNVFPIRIRRCSMPFQARHMVPNEKFQPPDAKLVLA